MTLSVEFFEDYKDSREINITRDDFTQRFKFHICGNFLEEAEENAPYGKADDVVALEAAYEIIPVFFMMPTYAGGMVILVLKDINIRMIHHDNWEIEASYSKPDVNGEGSGGANVDPAEFGPQVEDGAQYAPNNYLQLGFNVGANTTHAMQSRYLLTQAFKPDLVSPPVIYTPGLAAPVGQTKKDITGYDYYTRQFSFNVTCYKSATELSFKYVRRLFRIATTVNDRPFFGFPPGSVLFLEAQAQGDIYSVIPVTFEFQMQPNFRFSKTSPSALMDPDVDDPALQYDLINDPFFEEITYTNTIWKNSDGTNMFGAATGIYSGWNIVDYRYADGVLDGFGMIIQIPIMRLVHNIYGYANFKHLQCGHLDVIGS